jgi:alkylation response protein AidB-like acyl-CoA dehydrogenase
MNLDATPDDDRFRAEVRAFFETEYPKALLDKAARGQTLTRDDLMANERALQKKGWLAPGWPVEHGGTGWSIAQRFIFEEEMQRAGAPRVAPMGLLYLAPVIYTFGSEAQKARWLPDILSGRTFWAQGYSEPNAGSDLASLRTRAVADGDCYIVDGEKIWTSEAHMADWIFCLVRTSDGPRKQDGITMLCIDLRSPGVTVSPIITIDGAHHLNRVSFQNVRVPMENRIGEEGMGWTYSRHLLAYERTSYARLGTKRRDIDALRRRLSETAHDEADVAHTRLSEVEIAYLALHYTTLRALAPLAAGAAPGQEASALKILATENAQAITEIALDLAGTDAHPFPKDRHAPDWAGTIGASSGFGPVAAATYFGARAETIYGGSTEVQKNIIARQLGLPPSK